MLIFWLTTICIILANIYITKEIVLTEQKVNILKEKMRELSYEAVSIYESEGKQALRYWHRKLLKKESIRVELLDDKMNPILSRHKQSRNDDHRDDQHEQNRRYRHDEHKRGFFNEHLLKLADQNLVSGSGKNYTLRILPSPYLRSNFNPNSLHFYRFLISFMIIFLGSWWLARSVAGPVNILRKASEQFAEGGLGVRVSDKVGQRKDELGQLAHAFDHMATKIESLLSNQRQLFRDISHEIRTPLTRQKLAIELARESQKPDKLLTKIEEQNQVIEDLINNLLTLMQLEDKPHTVAHEQINLIDIISTVMAAAELNLTAKSLSLSVEFPKKEDRDQFQILGNAELITRAIENLLVNAIKFSPNNTSIRIAASLEQDTAFIKIADQGPGIPPKDLDHILDAFYRADQSRNSKTGGFGLGLAITNKIIQQHGGKISLCNREPTGLCVTLNLPTRHA